MKTTVLKLFWCIELIFTKHEIEVKILTHSQKLTILWLVSIQMLELFRYLIFNELMKSCCTFNVGIRLKCNKILNPSYGYSHGLAMIWQCWEVPRKSGALYSIGVPGQLDKMHFKLEFCIFDAINGLWRWNLRRKEQY